MVRCGGEKGSDEMRNERFVWSALVAEALPVCRSFFEFRSLVSAYLLLRLVARAHRSTETETELLLQTTTAEAETERDTHARVRERSSCRQVARQRERSCGLSRVPEIHAVLEIGRVG